MNAVKNGIRKVAIVLVLVSVKCFKREKNNWKLMKEIKSDWMAGYGVYTQHGLISETF